MLFPLPRRMGRWFRDRGGVGKRTKKTTGGKKKRGITKKKRDFMKANDKQTIGQQPLTVFAGTLAGTRVLPSVSPVFPTDFDIYTAYLGLNFNPATTIILGSAPVAFDTTDIQGEKLRAVRKSTKGAQSNGTNVFTSFHAVSPGIVEVSATIRVRGWNLPNRSTQRDPFSPTLVGQIVFVTDLPLDEAPLIATSASDTEIVTALQNLDCFTSNITPFILDAVFIATPVVFNVCRPGFFSIRLGFADVDPGSATPLLLAGGSEFTVTRCSCDLQVPCCNEQTPECDDEPDCDDDVKTCDDDGSNTSRGDVVRTAPKEEEKVRNMGIPAVVKTPRAPKTRNARRGEAPKQAAVAAKDRNARRRDVPKQQAGGLPDGAVKRDRNWFRREQNNTTRWDLQSGWNSDSGGGGGSGGGGCGNNNTC